MVTAHGATFDSLQRVLPPDNLQVQPENIGGVRITNLFYQHCWYIISQASMARHNLSMEAAREGSFMCSTLTSFLRPGCKDPKVAWYAGFPWCVLYDAQFVLNPRSWIYVPDTLDLLGMFNVYCPQHFDFSQAGFVLFLNLFLLYLFVLFLFFSFLFLRVGSWPTWMASCYPGSGRSGVSSCIFDCVWYPVIAFDILWYPF